jgi:hypothetical protein
MTKKRGVSLFEIILAIVLVGIVYSFAINSFTNKKDIVKDNVTLENLKQTLLAYDYINSIDMKCIASDLKCFVFVDNILQKETINTLFKNKPVVYDYDNKLIKKKFLSLELELLQRYDVVFEYKCDKYRQCTEQIVEYNDKVYIFNDTKIKPIIIKYLNDIDMYFQDKIDEVKDAF